ncbi:MAG: GreA/GreB family elongation factor [Patescibacteria group bacterium]
MPKKIIFTKDGYDELLKEKLNLQKQRVLAVAELQRSRELGDLSENAAYKVARSKLTSIDVRLRRLDKICRSVEVLESPSKDFADIGSRVSLQSKTETKEIVLVGGYESDITKGKISIYSPVGKAVRGKKQGDTVKVSIPHGVVSYTVLKIG